MLTTRTLGNGPPLVALHGFSHTGAQFTELAGHLGRTVIAPDLPGHGYSAGAPTEFPSVIDAVRESIEAIGTPVPLLGYSQGARVALATAVETSAPIDSLIVVSGTAGIEEATERSVRAAADRDLADRIRGDGIEAFLDAWTSTGLTSTAHRPPTDRSRDLERRRDNTADGLAAALVGYGQGRQPSSWGRLGEIRVPVLVMAGAEDRRYVTIADRMASSIEGAELVVVDGAGHDPIGDDPEAVAGALSAFLDGLG